jgi:hypothetical protein
MKTPTDIQELADTLEEMSLEFDALKHKQKRILERRGWKETCATPGSVWMWEKRINDGRTILVSFETAWCSESVAIEMEASSAAGLVVYDQVIQSRGAKGVASE